MVSPPCHSTLLYLVSDQDLGFTAHHPPCGLPQSQAFLCSSRFPSNPAARVVRRVRLGLTPGPRKRPARGLREEKRVRGPVPSPWSPCRRCREAGGPDGGNSTSHQLENPMSGFGLVGRAEPWEELLPPPSPSRGPYTPTPNSRRPADFSLTHSPPPETQPPRAQGPQPQPGHRPAPPRP